MRSTPPPSFSGAIAGATRRSSSSTRPCGAGPISPPLCAWAAICSANAASPSRRCASIDARSSSTLRWSSPTSMPASCFSAPAVSLRRLRSFEAATALAPDDPDAWSSRAGALRELGRLEESLEAARRALSLRHDFPEAAINLGNALLKLDRPEEALDAYLRASAAAPRSADGAVRSGAGAAQSRPLLRGAQRRSRRPKRSAAARLRRARAASC